MDPPRRTVRLLAVDPALVAFAGGVLGFLLGILDGIVTGLAQGGAAAVGTILFSPVLQGIFGLLAAGLAALLLNFVLGRVGGLQLTLAVEP